MHTKRLIWFVLIVMVMASLALGINQQDHNQSDLLSRLRSGEWKERAAAVNKLIAGREALRSDDVKNALIDLLDKENQEIVSAYQEGRPVSVKYGEGYSEYYSTLLDAVDQVADYNDIRQLNILVRCSYNPDSPFAMKLASYGEAPVPALLELAGGDFAPHRENALAILGEILKRDKLRIRRIRKEMREEIKQALVKGTNDEEFWVRSQAVQSIGKAGDQDAIPLLESIMQTDPGAIPVAAPGEKRFPVREEALKAISLIKNEGNRNPR
jgi:hypothetical protein